MVSTEPVHPSNNNETMKTSMVCMTSNYLPMVTNTIMNFQIAHSRIASLQYAHDFYAMKAQFFHFLFVPSYVVVLLLLLLLLD